MSNLSIAAEKEAEGEVAGEGDTNKSPVPQTRAPAVWMFLFASSPS